MINTKFKILVTAGFMILSLFTVTGCNTPSGEETPAHEHSYGDWETVKEPTCTEKGQKKRTCSGCENEETEVIAIDPDAHSFEDGWTIGDRSHWHAATCGHDVKSSQSRHRDNDNDGACDICSKETDPNHTHTFNTELWRHDNENDAHYHPSTCGHEGRKGDYAYCNYDSEGYCDVCKLNKDGMLKTKSGPRT